MLSILALSTLVLSSIAAASPISYRATTCSRACPQIFSLVVDTPGRNYSSLPIIQSGRSTYLTLDAQRPGSKDTLARFYRNDTTHLYATGFNTTYMQSKQTPPYQLITLESGFNIFSADPIGAARIQKYTTGTFGVVNATREVTFESDDGGVGGWWVCGAGSSRVWGVELGTKGFSNSSGICTRVVVKQVLLNATAADVC